MKTTTNRWQPVIPETKTAAGAIANCLSRSWAGTKLTLLSSMPTSTYISATATTKDSLYRCADDSTKEYRWNYSAKGLSHSTSQSSCDNWEYVGSYYTYDQLKLLSRSSSCSGSNCERLTKYRGPQFVDQQGTWVYRRFYGGSYRSNDRQGIYGQGRGQVLQRIEPSTNRAFQDTVVANIVARMNSAKNGGLYPNGGTPTASAIKAAGDLLLARQTGQSPVSSDESDSAAACRARFVLVLTDGESGNSDDVNDSPAEVTEALYKGGLQGSNYTGWERLTVYDGFPDNPIRTFAIAIPGLCPPNNANCDSIKEINYIADRGADGINNNGKPDAYARQDENELLDSVQSAINEAIEGDYVSTSIGVADKGGVAGSLALLALYRISRLEWAIGGVRRFWCQRSRCGTRAKNCIATTPTQVTPRARFTPAILTLVRITANQLHFSRVVRSTTPASCQP